MVVRSQVAPSVYLDLPVRERDAVEASLRRMRSHTPGEFAQLVKRVRRIVWARGECGSAAIACAYRRGDTIYLEVFSALSPLEQAATIFHEGLHLMGYGHSCSDPGCQRTDERTADFVYRMEDLYKRKLEAAMRGGVVSEEALVTTEVLGKVGAAGPIALAAAGAAVAGPVGLVLGGLAGLFTMDLDITVEERPLLPR
jgi:hypothetical protein